MIFLNYIFNEIIVILIIIVTNIVILYNNKKNKSCADTHTQVKYNFFHYILIISRDVN